MEWKAKIVNLIVFLIVAGAVWLSVTAVQEKMRFAEGSRQVIQILAQARDMMGKDDSLPQGMDVLRNFARTQRMAGIEERDQRGVLANPWGGMISAVMTTPVSLRIETMLPSLACRAISSYFINDVKGLLVEKVDVRDRQTNIETPLFVGQKPNKISWERVADACAGSQGVYLGITFSLR